MTINFNGIEGYIRESSPHGNYLIVQLSDNIAVCGTYSNQFAWTEIPDISSGFKSFITYYGFNNEDEYQLLIDFLENTEGYCRDGEERRVAKRTFCRLEAKIRDLTPDEVVDLVHLSLLEV